MGYGDNYFPKPSPSIKLDLPKSWLKAPLSSRVDSEIYEAMSKTMNFGLQVFQFLPPPVVEFMNSGKSTDYADTRKAWWSSQTFADPESAKVNNKEACGEIAQFEDAALSPYIFGHANFIKDPWRSYQLEKPQNRLQENLNYYTGIPGNDSRFISGNKAQLIWNRFKTLADREANEFDRLSTASQSQLKYLNPGDFEKINQTLLKIGDIAGEMKNAHYGYAISPDPDPNNPGGYKDWDSRCSYGEKITSRWLDENNRISEEGLYGGDINNIKTEKPEEGRFEKEMTKSGERVRYDPNLYEIAMSGAYTTWVPDAAHYDEQGDHAEDFYWLAAGAFEMRERALKAYRNLLGPLSQMPSIRTENYDPEAHKEFITKYQNPFWDQVSELGSNNLLGVPYFYRNLHPIQQFLDNFFYGTEKLGYQLQTDNEINDFRHKVFSGAIDYLYQNRDAYQLNPASGGSEPATTHEFTEWPTFWCDSAQPSTAAWNIGDADAPYTDIEKKMQDMLLVYQTHMAFYKVLADRPDFLRQFGTETTLDHIRDGFVKDEPTQKTGYGAWQTASSLGFTGVEQIQYRFHYDVEERIGSGGGDFYIVDGVELELEGYGDAAIKLVIKQPVDDAWFDQQIQDARTRLAALAPVSMWSHGLSNADSESQTSRFSAPELDESVYFKGLFGMETIQDDDTMIVDGTLFGASGIHHGDGTQELIEKIPWQGHFSWEISGDAPEIRDVTQYPEEVTGLDVFAADNDPNFLAAMAGVQNGLGILPALTKGAISRDFSNNTMPYFYSDRNAYYGQQRHLGVNVMVRSAMEGNRLQSDIMTANMYNMLFRNIDNMREDEWQDEERRMREQDAYFKRIQASSKVPPKKPPPPPPPKPKPKKKSSAPKKVAPTKEKK